MITAQQLEANRQNSQLSTGPGTEEGKRRSSMNATRHGLTGQVSVMTEEDRAAHDAFSAGMLKDLAPAGPLETQLAQRVATERKGRHSGSRLARLTNNRRLNRISAIEDNIFALGFGQHAADVDTEHPEIHAAFTAAKTFQAEAKQLQLLSLYEQRLNRAIQKNLQAQRKAERRHALEEAKKLYRFNGKKDLQNEPAVNGFVFSNAEIDRERRQKQQAKAA